MRTTEREEGGRLPLGTWPRGYASRADAAGEAAACRI